MKFRDPTWPPLIYTIKFTLLRCAIYCFLVYSQGCATITTIIPGVSLGLDRCIPCFKQLANRGIFNLALTLDKTKWDTVRVNLKSITAHSTWPFKRVQRWLLLKILNGVYCLLGWLYQVCLSVNLAQTVHLVSPWKWTHFSGKLSS